MLGGWDAFLDHFAYFGYLLPTLAVVLAREVGWLNWRTLLTLFSCLNHYSAALNRGRA